MQAVPLSPGFRPLAVNIAVPGALEIVTVPADHEFAPLVVVAEKAEYEACHTNRPLPSRPIGIAASSNAGRAGSSARTIEPIGSVGASVARSGAVTTTSPGCTAGTIDPVVTIVGTQPNAAGATENTARAASPASTTARTDRSTRRTAVALVATVSLRT